MPTIDLTSAKVTVLGNKDDVHTFTLKNPDDDPIISSDGVYSAQFDSNLDDSVSTVTLDESELADGVLKFPLTIRSGTYRVFKMNPRRTILTVEVEVR